MGGLLQKLLLRVLPDTSSAERQHVTAALGCCSTIRIDEHEQEHTHADLKEHSSSSAEDDSSYLG